MGPLAFSGILERITSLCIRDVLLDDISIYYIIYNLILYQISYSQLVLPNSPIDSILRDSGAKENMFLVCIGHRAPLERVARAAQVHPSPQIQPLLITAALVSDLFVCLAM